MVLICHELGRERTLGGLMAILKCESGDLLKVFFVMRSRADEQAERNTFKGDT